MSRRPPFLVLLRLVVFSALFTHYAFANGNVYVSRFWHNHQPTYWPEWNSNGSETSRV